MDKKVAIITAIYGNYENSCKPCVGQSISTDLICFTDNPNINSNGWELDTTPYHNLYPSKMDMGYYINSMNKVKELKDFNNTHSFNIAKYYKQAWNNIPRLKNYEVVIWIDGTIEIISNTVSEYVLKKCQKYGIVSWYHEGRAGNLIWEVEASYLPRYLSRHYLGQAQPIQDVVGQYHDYIKDGYDENFWETIDRKEGVGEGGDPSHFGIWLTAFVAFNNKSEEVKNFLELWYLQTLKYTTQDQIGFPKVVQDTKIIPYTLPDNIYKGYTPHKSTDMYIKHLHSHPEG